MPVSVATIGAGEVVNDLHLPAWNAVRGVKVVAVCDINEDAASSTAHRWNVPRYYTQFSDLLNQEKPSLVDICTPPATHYPLTAQALQAGCNVLLEKPMAMTLEDNDKIIEAYAQREDKSLKLGVIHNWLFTPSFLRMISKVEKGDIGEILGVEIKALSTKNDPMLSDPEHWCHSLPGGRYGEGLIHLIYLLYRLLGNLEVEHLWVAKRGTYPWATYDELLITFSAGERFATVYNSLNSPFVDVPVIIVYGTRGHLRFEDYDWSVLDRSADPPSAFLERRPSLQRSLNNLRGLYQLSISLGFNIFNIFNKGILRQSKTMHSIYFSHFIDSIVNDKEPPVSPQEAYEANRIFLKVLDELEQIKPWKSQQ